MFDSDARMEVGINLGGKLRFQQAISFMLGNLAGTEDLGRWLKATYYLKKEVVLKQNPPLFF